MATFEQVRGKRALAVKAELKARPQETLTFLEKLAVKVGRGTIYFKFRHLFLIWAREYKKTLPPEQAANFDKVWGT